MKQLFLLVAATCFTVITFAQSEKYISNMKKNIAQLDSNYSTEMANSFVRIGDAEKTQWLPYYYAAYCYVMQAYTGKDNSVKDALAEKANTLINQASTILGKDNSEIAVIRSMISTTHLMVDPQSRFMTYGPEASSHSEDAQSLDSTNPRPVLLEAQMKFYTPEAFGGGKDVAKVLFDKAALLFANFKPVTEISPVWGKSTLDYFLSQYK
ncbi:MAG: hypothetical protein ABI208_08065 [Ginsengibacter sp.]|jgi:hypothetical protein